MNYERFKLTSGVIVLVAHDNKEAHARIDTENNTVYPEPTPYPNMGKNHVGISVKAELAILSSGARVLVGYDAHTRQVYSCMAPSADELPHGKYALAQHLPASD